jgi:hypothetical protein
MATTGTVPGRTQFEPFMGERTDACRRRANDCELAASRVKDPEVRAAYLDMAARWRRMAAQQEGIDDVLGDTKSARAAPLARGPARDMRAWN